VTPEVLAALRRRVARLAPAATLAETTHRPVELVNAEGERASLDLLRDQPVAAFCGIGNPEAFRRTLADLGARPVDFRAYADHHAYSLADVEALRGWGRPLAAGAWLVTTQKDLVKLPVSQLGGRPLWAVRVRLDFRAGQSDLERLLAGVLPPH
jgi:tetraacyldisaccharide 4'-kinase